MNPPENFDTPRLHLRPPVMADAVEIFRQYARDREVTRYVSWRPHSSIKVTQEFLRRCLKVWKDGTAFPYVILSGADNQLLGMIEIRIQGWKADIGYGLAQAYWGKGIATEAARTLVGWALDQPEIYRVWAVCDVDNAASRRVLEKCGMQCEGLLKRWLVHPGISQEPRDCYCYAITK